MEPENSSSSCSHNLVVGRTRVRCPKGVHRGTVVYVGPVASAPPSDKDSVYAGVVWDDPSRGKHNGTVLCRTTNRLVRHFCATHPTAGSFVKLQRLDTGVALTLELLRQKYVERHSDECVAPHNLLPHHAQTASGKNDKPIELLGELQIRERQQLSDLVTVSLRLAGISSVAVAPSEWQTLQHVREMDLAGNLLWEWSEVWRLLDQFPQLQKLSVAANRLGDYKNEVGANGEKQKHLALRHLNLNETNIQSVSTLLALGEAFPALEELVLANNTTTNPKFILDKTTTTTELESTSNSTSNNGDSDDDVVFQDLAPRLAAVFSNLTFLDYSNCTGLLPDSVHAWSQLPKLQSLSLDDNPDITRFSKQQRDSDPDSSSSSSSSIFYPSLQHLQFAGTSVAKWEDVDAWWNSSNNDLPHLSSLRLRQCPLTARMSSPRTQIVAQVPALRQLNASAVTEPERREAARWCLRQQQQQEQQPSDEHNPPPPHPQADYWKVQYPDLAALMASTRHSSSPTSTTATGSLASSASSSTELAIVNVTIRSMAPSSCTMEPLIRRLPLQLTVGKLKALCARQFGLDRDLQTLHYKQRPDSGFPEALDDGCDDHTLAYYGVPDGAEIYMNERPVGVQQQEEALAKLRLEERVEQQERELHDFQERQKRAT